MKRDNHRSSVTRRSALGYGAALIGTGITACSDDEQATGGGGGDTTGPGSSSGTDSGSSSASGSTSTSGSSATSTSSGSNNGWASGGTASMTDKRSYPDPFQDPLGNACTLTTQMTLGPCYAETIDREDISEGGPGLPVRLAFLVVDESCNPVPNATVDVWHTNIEGIYSGGDASAMCTLNDPEAVAGKWYRGMQTGGADGKVYFDTCFPGWYGGRAIHIHFQVRVGAQVYRTSQIFWPQAIVDEIFATHPEYVGFGQPDTSNAADGIHEASTEVEYAQMTDGAMLAWKVVVV
jgi:protocatechuate 3,4-dioxygenase beta subunit